ncbi:MAG: hypothetical protein CVV33_01595 [Methanomicrobiales archaeon HGW-Methanomicrobiales-4]|nr:MAG: hypothetical protein CVV33_01595 [Methanomicrobiales archaeon HGW-Methanomicrobiales-4]
MTAVPSLALIGGNMGWYEFHCPADGAKVYLDNEYKGDIIGGMLAVPIYTTGAPFKQYTVTYDSGTDYQSITRAIPGVPVTGQTIDIWVDITPVPTPFPTPKPIGGETGYYAVHSNEDHVQISLDGEMKGETDSSGYLWIQVYPTATPYKTLTATKPGYVAVVQDIGMIPSKGESVDLYVTMNPDILIS